MPPPQPRPRQPFISYASTASSSFANPSGTHLLHHDAQHRTQERTKRSDELRPHGHLLAEAGLDEQREIADLVRDLVEEDGDGGGGAEGGGGVEGGGEGEAVGDVVREVGEEVEVGGESD